MIYIFVSFLTFIIGDVDFANDSCQEVDLIVQQLIDILPQIKLFLSRYDSELMWIYPFAWSVILVKKIFYA